MTKFSETVAALPSPSGKRLAVRVTKDAERQLRGGHPWLFDQSVNSVKGDGQPGDLAVVFDHDRRFTAIGLWDPDSPIRVRILHSGKPTPIDSSFFAAKLQAAWLVRQPLIRDGQVTGYRLVHGENDGLGALVVDVYRKVVVIKLYSAAWIAHLATLLPLIVDLVGASAVVVRLSRIVQMGETHGLVDGQVVAGELDGETVEFLENGLTFAANVLLGQKTGHFLDQRHNRDRVSTLTSGARVLDMFACTGGFSVHAAAGGASEVTSSDRSAAALDAAEAHMQLNSSLQPVAACKHRVIEGDAFDTLDQLAARRELFDVVIVDPPSFAARGSDTDRAIRAYRKLTLAALEVLAPDGTLVQSSCSSRVPANEFFAGVADGVATSGRSIGTEVRTAHDIDHPIGFREGAYLKTIFARVK